MTFTVICSVCGSPFERHRKSYTDKPVTCYKRKCQNTTYYNYTRIYDRQIRTKYGITAAQYDEMFKAQGGVCYFCGASTGQRRLNIDHDHKTGRVRGLLCTTCNVGLDWFERNRDKAITYTEGEGVV